MLLKCPCVQSELYEVMVCEAPVCDAALHPDLKPTEHVWNELEQDKQSHFKSSLDFPEK